MILPDADWLRAVKRGKEMLDADADILHLSHNGIVLKKNGVTLSLRLSPRQAYIEFEDSKELR